MVPSTTRRVPLHTADDVNRRISQQTQHDIEAVSSAGPRAIKQRLLELDEEWDVERMLEANAATACLIGCALGTFVDRRFFILPAVVGGFLLQHAVQGWCPPLPVFRRYGFRTQSEIEGERCELKRRLYGRRA